MVSRDSGVKHDHGSYTLCISTSDDDEGVPAVAAAIEDPGKARTLSDISAINFDYYPSPRDKFKSAKLSRLTRSAKKLQQLRADRRAAGDKIASDDDEKENRDPSYPVWFSSADQSSIGSLQKLESFSISPSTPQLLARTQARTFDLFDLPVVAQRSVLLKVSIKDRMRLRLVSRHFNNAERSLWRSAIGIHFQHLVERCFPRTQREWSCHIDWLHRVVGGIVRQFTGTTSVQEILFTKAAPSSYFMFQYVDVELLQHFQRVSSTWPTVTKFDFTGCCLAPEALRRLPQVFPNISTLFVSPWSFPCSNPAFLPTFLPPYCLMEPVDSTPATTSTMQASQRMTAQVQRADKDVDWVLKARLRAPLDVEKMSTRLKLWAVFLLAVFPKLQLLEVRL